MNQDILFWIPLNTVSIVAAHLAFALVGLVITLTEKKHITVEDATWAFIFGFFYSAQKFVNMEQVLIDLRPHSEITRLEEKHRYLLDVIERHIKEKSDMLLAIESLNAKLKSAKSEDQIAEFAIKRTDDAQVGVVQPLPVT